MYAVVKSFGLAGVESFLVEVEIDCRRGMPGFDIVGLPDASVKESRDRVRAAVQNLGYPSINSKVVVNLAPADTRKIGSVYDLPIILALLVACGYENYDLSEIGIIGEIGLSGEIRGVTGTLPMVLDAAKLGAKKVIVPFENIAEASVAKGVEVLAAKNVREVIEFLKGREKLEHSWTKASKTEDLPSFLDFSDVKGQSEAKRAMEVAAAGGHNIMLIGPPGTGKSMLAKRLPTILPSMTTEESIETTKIYSVAGMLSGNQGLIIKRPFRAPHHSASAAALAGGGTNPKPGDISLSHNGVLFLDEMPEFPKANLEILRQPLEEGEVSISRVKQRVNYPARAMLVGAMNPCPCGFYGAVGKECVCTPIQIQKYLGKISGPLLDRIDIQIEVQPVEYKQLAEEKSSSSSEEIRKRVESAREIQQKRYEEIGITCNSQLPAAVLREYCKMEPTAETILKSAFDRLGLSARGYDRILKVARTVADMEESSVILSKHISQAIQFRSLDRKYWRA